VTGAEDLYFDAISRVQLPHWAQGDALAATPGDPALALRRYESRHRKAVAGRQRGYRLAAALLVPASRTGLRARNLAVRLLPR
jgi:hypothetical protein